MYKDSNFSDVDVPMTQVSRRRALAVGAAAGVGLLSMPLPAAAIATSGSGAGGLTFAADSGWSIVEWSVDSSTYFAAVTNNTGSSHTVVAKFYYLNGSNYQEVAVGDSKTVANGSFTNWNFNDATFTKVSGTYAVRLFVDGATNVYVAQASQYFNI